MDLPGWNSVESTGFFDNLFFWISIGALLLLGAAEVASHRYGERHDWLIAQQQKADKDASDKEIARLNFATTSARVEAERANERAAELEKEAADARLETERLRSAFAPRALSPEQARTLVSELKKLGGKFFVVGRDEDEPRQYADQIISALNEAGLLDGYALTIDPSQNWTGIRLFIPGPKKAEELESDPFPMALRRAGLPVIGINSTADISHGNGLVTHPVLIKFERSIYVGHKPLPKL